MKVAKFGDGYSQRALDGLNYQERTATLVWPALTQAQFDEINDWFDDHSAEAFDYAIPPEDTELRWIWLTKTPGWADAINRSLSVNIERVFDL